MWLVRTPYNREHLSYEMFIAVRAELEQAGFGMSAIKGDCRYFIDKLDRKRSNPVLYHVTETGKLPCIKSAGLQPATMTTRNSDRWDTLGNIYGCETLGTPTDHEEGIVGTAHWWRSEFAKRDSHMVERSILEIRFPEDWSGSLFDDPWSHSGIIIRANSIPWDWIHLRES